MAWPLRVGEKSGSWQAPILVVPGLGLGLGFFASICQLLQSILVRQAICVHAVSSFSFAAGST